MNAPQIISTDGEDLVILKRSAYDALVRDARAEQEEDAWLVDVYDLATAESEAEAGFALPPEVWDEMEVGSTVSAVRRYRRLSQDELATLAGVAPSAVEAMEATHYPPPSPELTAVARALGAPEPVLTAPL